MPPKVKLGGSGVGTASTKKTTSSSGVSSSKSQLKESSAPIEPVLLTVRPHQSLRGPNDRLSTAEIPLDIIRELDLSPGDRVVVSKANDKGVVVNLAPFTGDPVRISKLKTIHLSQQIRNLIGVLPGEKVSVTKYVRPIGVAKEISLVSESGQCDSDSARAQLGSALQEIGMICEGAYIKVASQKYHVCKVDIEETSAFGSLSLAPDDSPAPRLIPYIVNAGTSVLLSDDLHELAKIPPVPGYGTLGGLTKQIALFRAKIDLPLQHPELFKRFSIAPDRGFLLYGPPGTGKSKLLRAVAQESGAYILTINGPSIVSKFLGETEAALRKVFEEANEFQPSMILIDEIDSLVPKRDSDDSGEAESRLVSTLLTLMDGIDSQSHVVVIGATNRINSIDPALRRPGRFGQEIEVGIPDAMGRKEILSILLSRVPHHLSEEFLQEISSKTHGFVGADLDALCRDAVMFAIQKALQTNAPADQTFLQEEDVRHAFVEIRPSAMREIFLETPKVYWSDIGGQQHVKHKLKEAVELPLSHPEAFKRLGIKPPQGVLLYGPPGCSKTLIAKALATEAGLNFLAVKGPELFNKFVGESERAIREIFRKARAAAPSVIFFDEIDAISTARGHGEAGGDRVLTSLLNEMDGIEVLKDVTILAATNLPDTIDSALLRPGRLDRLIYVPPPDYEARLSILSIQFKKMSIGSDVDIQELARETDNCSGAEVVALCQEAGLAAMSESLEIETIDRRHFIASLKVLRRAITPKMLQYFADFEQQSS